MKILRVTSSGYLEGGVENGILDIQPLLEARGHIVKTLACDSRPDLPHFNEYFYRAPFGIFRRLMFTCNPYAYFALKKVLREFKPDIVHLHTLGSASPLVLFALKNQPTVATVHGPEGYTKELLMWCLPKSDFRAGEYDLRDLNFFGKLRFFYFRYINYPIYILGLKNVSCFISISTYIEKLLLNQGIQSVHIPNGSKLLSHRPLTSNTISHAIVFVGRIEKYKGLEYAIHAMPAIIAQFPDTQLLIAGTGSDKTELELLLKNLGLANHVTFLGQINGNALQELYEKASVVVVPSIWPEAFGKIGIEAMSVGRPVVASDVGGISDWLEHNKTGFLVPPKDPHAISSVILKLFSDPTKLLSMGEEAHIRAQEFSLESHTDRIEEIYRSLAEVK